MKGLYQIGVKLYTTRSWRCLGLHPRFGLWDETNFGMGVIIGIVDSGITRDHVSFRHDGVPPPPSHWKGVSGCNNKIIGIRDYTRTGWARYGEDFEGHGTHVASMASGNFVHGAHVMASNNSFHGVHLAKQASGIASGTAPLSHLAIYKVEFDSNKKAPMQVAQAIDDAVNDGVQILNLSSSVKLDRTTHFHVDPIAISSYRACRQGVLVVFAAGNEGPGDFTCANGYPWALTVGASTIDRKIRTSIHLGDNQFIYGESISTFVGEKVPIVYARVLSNKKYNFCRKVVLCEQCETEQTWEQAQIIKDLGGVAMIVMNLKDEGYTTCVICSDVLPIISVGYHDALKIKMYIHSTKSPVVTIKDIQTLIGVDAPPYVTSFSSRGPNMITRELIKPDIIAPGVNLVGASLNASEFVVMSGTSMACPIITGLAALIKNAHPEWSPAAIKSALMTTSDVLSSNGEPIQDHKKKNAQILSLGCGHVNPLKMINPGLVYDIRPEDYIGYLFGLGYGQKQVSKIVGKNVKVSQGIDAADLNLPSLMFKLNVGETRIFKRVVTNVGDADSTYVLRLDSLPKGVILDVEPKELKFSRLNEKTSYKMCFTLQHEEDRELQNEEETDIYREGSITWMSSKHYVRTPFLIQM